MEVTTPTLETCLDVLRGVSITVDLAGMRRVVSAADELERVLTPEPDATDAGV